MADITQTGAVALKGLKGLNQQQRQPMSDAEIADYVNKNYGYKGSGAALNQQYRPNPEVSYGLELANLGVGDSSLDKNIQTLGEAQNINNFRGVNQSGWAQLGNGLLKMATTAGTTFLDGTLGALWGIGQGIKNLADGDSSTGFWEGMWHNDFNKAMSAVQDNMEKIAPNYYTDEQMDGPWYSAANIISTNFLGDKLLKNAGYTIGALGTALIPGFNGAWIGKGIAGLGKFVEGAEAIKGFQTAGKVADRLARTFVSANSEAAIEAINAVNGNMKFINNNLEQRKQEALTVANNTYQQALATGVDPGIAMQDYLKTSTDINASLAAAKKKAESDARDIGNSVYGLNILLLSVTNNLEFSKFMKGGFNTQKGIKDMIMKIDGVETNNLVDFAKGVVTGKAALETGAKTAITPGRVALGSAARFMEEGFEEGAQNMISDSNQIQAQAKLNQWASQKYRANKDKNSLFASSINPTVTNDLVDYMKAVNKTWNTDFGTFESPGWQDVFLGGLTGVLGTLGVRPARENPGKLKIGWQGGVYEEYQELKDKYAENQAKVEEVNKRITAPDFIKNTRHAITAITLTNDMNEALQNNNIRYFKNAELMSVLNDALYFKDNKMLDGYKEFYKQAALNISDQDVMDVKSQMRDMETGKSYFDGKTDDDIKKTLQDKAASTLTKIDSALKNYEEQSLLNKEKFAKINPLFAEDAVREMTAKATLLDDLQRRRDELQQKADATPESTKVITGNNYTAQIKEIDNQIKETSDELKDYHTHPENLIQEIGQKYEIYQKAQVGKDAQKTIERYQTATTLQDVADAFYYNNSNEDNINRAIETAEGDNKTLLESFRPFMAQLNSAKDAINTTAKNITSDPQKQVQFVDIFSRYVDRALGNLVGDPNTVYNKESLASAIKKMGDSIKKATENSEDPTQEIAGTQQQTILHNIADYLSTVSTAQAASASPVKRSAAAKKTAPTPIRAGAPLDNADAALRDTEKERPIGKKEDATDVAPLEPVSMAAPAMTIPKEKTTPTAQEESKETPTEAPKENPTETPEETPEEKPTIEELVATEKPKSKRRSHKKATPKQEEEFIQFQPIDSEENKETPVEEKSTENTPPVQFQQPITENTEVTKDEDAPVMKKSFRGNAFLQYNQDIKSVNAGKNGVANERTAASAKKFFTFLKSEGIDIGHIVNNFLSSLMKLSEDGKLPVEYMAIIDKDGMFHNDVFLVTRYTEEVAKICPTSDPKIAGNIKETNRGKYLVVGVLGYSNSEKALADGHKFILNRLKTQSTSDHYAGKYYVDYSLENKIYDVSPGSIVRKYATETDENPNSNLATLLADRRTNPQGMTIDSIRWAVLEGGEEQVDEADIKLINFDGTEQYLSLQNATHPGKVFMYIPGADGVLIPQYIDTLAYNDPVVNHNSKYWKDIQSKIEAVILASDVESRIIAISELRDSLIFSVGNNIYYEANPEDPDFDSIKYRKGNLANNILIYPGEGSTNPKEAIRKLQDAIQEINPRLNISTTVLGINGGPKYYMDGGLFQVNTRLLGTVNAQNFLYPITKDGRAIETFQTELGKENQIKGTASNAETVVYINNDKYYYNNLIYYDAAHHEIIDENKLKSIRDIQAIQEDKVPVVRLGNTETPYWDIDGTVYTIYKQGGYYPLTAAKKEQYLKVKARQEAAEKKAKNLANTEAEITDDAKKNQTPKFKLGEILTVQQHGTKEWTYTIVEQGDGESKGFWKLEDGLIKYWVKPSFSRDISLVSEQEIEQLLLEKKSLDEGLTIDELSESPVNTDNSIKSTGKAVVNGETLDNRKSFKDLESQANLVNFDNTFRKLSKESKDALKEAITKATGKQVKGLKDIREILTSSTKEAHALFMTTKSEQDIEKLIETINSCGI